MKRFCLVMVALLGVTMMVTLGASADDKEEKSTIKNIMKKYMKGGLCKKVASGKASDEEKAQLVVMFTALAKAKPKKGDEASWKTKTSALVKAAEAAKAGDSGAGTALKMAANCKACHSVHK